MTDRATILRDLERLLRQLERSTANFQYALDSKLDMFDLGQMHLKHSKMGVDGLIVDAVLEAMRHRS